MKATSPATFLSLSDQWLALLQDSGYRLTNPLRVIVELLTTSTRALGPLDLFDQGRKVYAKLGLVTVYRSLEKLEELGLVQRLHQANGCHTYFRATHGHEHILLCTRCGRVEFFSGDDLTKLLDTTARKSGYVIKEHWLQLHGLCANCQ
jgi:Fur family transcriptional regulator, ferric uptake regulator